MTAKNHLEGLKFKAQFDLWGNSLPRSELDWVVKLRHESMAKFLQFGLPGPKVEAWKYTNLGQLNSGNYELITSADNVVNETGLLENLKGSKVIFTDGFYNKASSTIESQNGVKLLSLNDYLKDFPEAAQKILNKNDDDSSLQSLNTALMTGGYVLFVDKNTTLTAPIQILHNTTTSSENKSIATKCFIDVQENSFAQIVEIFIGADEQNYWRHHVTEAIVSENAVLEIYQIQEEGKKAIHTADTHVDVGQRANFKHYSLNLGGKISRTEIKPTLKGLQANVDLRGAFLGRNGNAHDVFTHMKHLCPEGTSDQIYRGVLDKGGKSSFQGKVYVAKDAQLTNADQSNKNLILDRNAEANSKPELLIYADDVKCSHGATVGELDADALYYLKSRGLDQNAATALLVEAFVSEVYEEIKLEPLRSKYLELALNWLSKEHKK
ncbi:MAG: Fe-S cluster assembly protein SufD [Emcibacteraceae bacterium]|jgi:Fe-S cluster assembly protein SufD|tara:strand:+ start:9225 stop:10538 length:1314 start_codon:yes stop_codon:yes gene_type:complete